MKIFHSLACFRTLALLSFLLWLFPAKAQLWTEKQKWFSGIAAALEELDGEDAARLYEAAESPNIYLQIRKKRAFYFYSSDQMFITTLRKGKVKVEGDSLILHFHKQKFLSSGIRFNHFRRVKGPRIVRRFKAEIWNEYDEWKLTENEGQRENFYESRDILLKRSKLK